MVWPMQTLREAQSINKSLSFLEQAVTALSRKEPHIPFRQSRLTSVLRDALGGGKPGCKVCGQHLQPYGTHDSVASMPVTCRGSQAIK